MPERAPSAVAADRLASLPAEARLIVAASEAVERASTPLEVAQGAFPVLTELADAQWLTLGRVEGERLWPLAALGDFPEALQPYLQLVAKGVPRGVGVAWQAIEENRPLYLEDYSAHGAAHEGLARDFAGAIAYIPLRDEHGQAWGTLAVAATQARAAWPEGMKVALETVARLVAGAVERTLAQEAERRQARYLSLLTALQDALQATLTPQEVAEVAIGHLGPALNASAVHALSLSDGALRALSAWGSMPAGVRAVNEGGLPLTQAPYAGQVAASGQAAYLDDYSGSPGALDFGAEAVSAGIEPIKDPAGRVIGLLSLARPARLGPWAAEERAFMARSAAAISLALARAGERAELLEERQRAEVLAALSDALSSAQEPAAVVRAALEQLGPALGATYVYFTRVQGDAAVLTDYWGEIPEAVREPVRRGIPRGQGLTWRAVQSGVPVYASHYLSEPGALALDMPDCAEAVKPIRTRGGQVTATLAVVRPPGEWTRGERGLLARGAATIGHALERAEASELLAEKTRELEARNAEQETFVYTASHDLRAPLLSLQGMAGVLEECLREGDTPGAWHSLARIQANVEKMDALLDSLLRLSRVGRVTEDAEHFPLAETVAAVRADLEGRLEGRGVSLELPVEWPHVDYPPAAAYQLLSNLLGNAVKWAGARGLAPRVRLEWSREGERLRLAVHDNGPGVPGEYRERVFRLFEKLDARSEGTGVGLAIVKRILERHGGSIRVEDSPLGGAAFVLELPVA